MKRFTSRKNIYLLLAAASIGFILYLSIICISIKSNLEQQNHTILLDKTGKNIYPEDRINSHKEIPDFITHYTEKEKKLDQLPKMLYPASKSKQLLAKSMTKILYSKEDLMKFYANNAYFDYGLIGMSTASKYYFNKNLWETSKIEQIFLLSRIGQQKTGNTLIDSQNFLKHLIEKGYLNNKEYFAINSKLNLLIRSLKSPNTYAQSYAQQVLEESKKVLGISESKLMRMGYKINTNLDKKIQQKLYLQFQINKNFPIDAESGMVILEKDTGKILGLMGGRQYQNSSLNRASQIKRQPASTFKPLVVYAPAIELGWKQDQQLKDSPIRVGGYKPINRDNKYRNQVSLKEALIQSYNVPTVWLLSKIGLNTGINYINKFNLFEIDPKDGYKLALGFSSKGASPLALAQAYSIFPNNGNMVEAHTIDSISDQNGKQILKNNIQQTRIIKKQTAIVMNSLLRSVVTEGTGSKADIEGEFVAGKTGTTSYDGWFVGYTNQYIAAVWMGPDEVNPINKLTAEDGRFPSIFFKNVMTEIIKN